jgi:hypothetical protein
MAKNSNIKEENSTNDYLAKIIERKDEELNNLKNELQNVTSKFDALEKMIANIQKNQNNFNMVEKPIVQQVKMTDDTVKIGSCLIGKHFLCDSNGTEIIEFDDAGDISSISTRLLDSLMTSKNKALFKEGLLYFIDDVWYDRYSIKKNVVLDDQTIDSIYKLPIDNMVKEINKITNDGKNEKVKYCLYWIIVKNIVNGKDGYNDKNKEITIGNLFGVDINNSIGQLSYCQQTGFFK